MAYRPQKSINLSLAGKNEAALGIINSLVPTLHPKDPLRTRSLIAAIFLFFDRKVLQSMLRNMLDKLEPTNKKESVIHEAISRRLPERDRLSMEMIVQKTSNLNLCISDPTLSVDMKPHTPTMLAMYDENIFCIWRDILVDQGVNLVEFIEDELDAGQLRQDGWNASSLKELFDYEFMPRPIRGARVIGFPDCERCGAAGTKISSSLMVDLEWRQTLQTIRRRMVKSTAGVHVREITPPSKEDDVLQTRDSSASPVLRPLFEELETHPYRIVCSTKCIDGVCVAWMYEDEPGCNQECKGSRLGPNGKKEMNCGQSYDQDDAEADLNCPSRCIPGAFVD
jgi:hypothetical protein